MPKRNAPAPAPTPAASTPTSRFALAEPTTTLHGADGKVSFDASSLMARLLSNGDRAGQIQRPSQARPPLDLPPYSLAAGPAEPKSAATAKKPSASDGSGLPPLPAFPSDLIADARMLSVPAYSRVPPSVQSTRRRRNPAASNSGPPRTMLSTLAAATVASSASGASVATSRLPSHARRAA